ncbi:MAG: hypothetical protein ACPG4T_07650, partial [Nannocystaceae bacterium]
MERTLSSLTLSFMWLTVLGCGMAEVTSDGTGETATDSQTSETDTSATTTGEPTTEDPTGLTTEDPTGPTTEGPTGPTTEDPTEDPTTEDPTTEDPTTEDPDTETETDTDTETESDTDEPLLDCSKDGWTCVTVDPEEPYGEHTFEVPAAQSWVNTGLYLEMGEQAIISESGEWFVSNNEGDSIDHGPCLVGDFVARIGLYYKDEALTCISGNDVVFTADKPGILFVGALPSNDLGEAYETRLNATGAKDVTISSDGQVVPTIEGDEAAGYDFDAITSNWVEVRGEHVILTLPVATAAQDADLLANATDGLDAIYDQHELLRSAVPHAGQPLRFFP